MKQKKGELNLVEGTVKPAVDFINKIKSEERVVIVCGHDNDSICSAAVVSKMFTDVKKMTPQIFVTKDNFALTEDDMAEIEKLGPTHVIVLDIAHIASKKVETSLASYKSLVVDHHQPLQLPGITYCNPRAYDPKIYMPVSYLVYKIYEKLGDPTDAVWIAAVGVLTDHGVSNAKDLFAFVKKNVSHLIGDTELNEKDMFTHSFLGTLAKILDSARIVEGRKGSQLTANFLANSQSYEDIFNDASADKCPLLYWSEMVKKEFKRLVSDFNRKRKLVKGKIIFYEFNSKMAIKSSLSGYLTQFYKDKILIISQKNGENFDISFRRGDNVKVDLNKLAKKAIAGIPNSEGGGHEAASGARIPVKYIAKFLKQL